MSLPKPRAASDVHPKTAPSPGLALGDQRLHWGQGAGGDGETRAKAMQGGKGEVCAVGSVMSCRFAASLSFCFCCLFSELFPSSGIEGLCDECALK